MRLSILTLVALTAISCGGDKEGTVDSGTVGTTDSATTLAETDNDGDGFTADEDCDDENFDINPGGVEVCDGVDNDCDGLTDDDDDSVDEASMTAWYRDRDGDGYGDEEAMTLACEAPEWTVPENPAGFDCDDLDPAYHPGADESDCADPNDYNCDGSVGYEDADGDGWAACEECDDTNPDFRPDADEICDELDNDCDGNIDDADSGLDLSTATEWFADSDGDGFGNADDMMETCVAPSGYVEDDSDCDDDELTTYPGADEYCDEVDSDCDGSTDDGDELDASTWHLDGDGDGYGASHIYLDSCVAPAGYVSDSTDCDDTDDSSHPGGTEVCDDADNDCDGTVDNDASDEETWYMDLDGDGYGDSSNSVTDCDRPSQSVDNALDCDDGDAKTNPGSYEVCDSVDNDCDGTDDNDAIDIETWYLDADSDGFGDISGGTTESCDQPTGYSDDSTDCDDSDSSINPDASEVCDSVDNDCDGNTDESDAVDATIWYHDGDSDGYGDSRKTAYQCDQPSGYVADSSDCDDTESTVNPGAVEVCNSGTDDDCDGLADDDDSSLDTTTATTWYQDADGDGYGDAAGLTIDTCDQPTGYSASGVDCDDADSSVWEGCGGGSTQVLAGDTCATILSDYPTSIDGMYWIDPDGDGDTTDAYAVYCDMTNGGWAYESMGTPFTLSFTGGTQSIETPAVSTEFLFTVYGAAGGVSYNATTQLCGSGSASGGFGGSATGSKTFATSTTLYVEVGGQGDDGGCADQGSGNDRSGGYNGGGRGTKGGSGGGGATDIRTTSGDLYSRLLVAGGGGGCGYESCYFAGGDGGGLAGDDGNPGGSYYGYGGSASSGGGNSANNSSGYGYFGVGGSNTQVNDEGGGGGGYYGGGSGGGANSAAGGGSSYYGGMDGDFSTTSGVNSGDGYVEYIFR